MINFIDVLRFLSRKTVNGHYFASENSYFAFLADWISPAPPSSTLDVFLRCLFFGVVSPEIISLVQDPVSTTLNLGGVGGKLATLQLNRPWL